MSTAPRPLHAATASGDRGTSSACASAPARPPPSRDGTAGTGASAGRLGTDAATVRPNRCAGLGGSGGGGPLLPEGDRVSGGGDAADGRAANPAA
jgi:hypothetical protein